VSSITIINMMSQFGAYLTIIIYDRKTFLVQDTGAKQCTSNIVCIANPSIYQVKVVELYSVTIKIDQKVREQDQLSIHFVSDEVKNSKSQCEP
jgi:hypothetical protein